MTGRANTIVRNDDYGNKRYRIRDEEKNIQVNNLFYWLRDNTYSFYVDIRDCEYLLELGLRKDEYFFNQQDSR